MIRLCGLQPRYHAGKYCEVKRLLPCRGGIVISRRGIAPRDTSTSTSFNRSRCFAVRHRPRDARVANACGLERAMARRKSRSSVAVAEGSNGSRELSSLSVKVDDSVDDDLLGHAALGPVLQEMDEARVALERA